MNAELGTTRVVKRSQYVPSHEAAGMPYQDPYGPQGSCLLMDYRLSHQGLANRSQQVRPVLSLVYGRPWFRDSENFKKQERLAIPADEFLRIPESYHRLFNWMYRLQVQ